MSKRKVTLKLNVDRAELEKAQKIVDEYSRKIKEANALADELASLKIDIKFLD